jgi:hypothetical protein
MNNLITIDELVRAATLRGVNFDGADPKTRIAYLTKLRLLPNAIKRKSGNQLIGHYPISAVETLDQIEKAKASGASYCDLKPTTSLPTISYQPSANFSYLAATLLAGIILGIFISRFFLFGPVAGSQQASLFVPLTTSDKSGIENLGKIIRLGDIKLTQ